MMITWNNLDKLTSYQELEKTESVDLAAVMAGENGAERVKNYSVPMAEGLAYNPVSYTHLTLPTNREV